MRFHCPHKEGILASCQHLYFILSNPAFKQPGWLWAFPPRKSCHIVNNTNERIFQSRDGVCTFYPGGKGLLLLWDGSVVYDVCQTLEKARRSLETCQGLVIGQEGGLGTLAPN